MPPHAWEVLSRPFQTHAVASEVPCTALDDANHLCACWLTMGGMLIINAVFNVYSLVAGMHATI